MFDVAVLQLAFNACVWVCVYVLRGSVSVTHIHSAFFFYTVFTVEQGVVQFFRPMATYLLFIEQQ